MRIHASGGRSLGLSLIFVCLCLWAQAQPGFSGRIVVNVNDPSVTATVDKPQAAQGELVTLALSGLGARQSAGLSASASDYPLEKKSDDVYTFLMPSGTIYKCTYRDLRLHDPGADTGRKQFARRGEAGDGGCQWRLVRGRGRIDLDTGGYPGTCLAHLTDGGQGYFLLAGIGGLRHGRLVELAARGWGGCLEGGRFRHARLGRGAALYDRLRGEDSG
ncbi:hypothetical protein [Parabacteroides sp.]